MVYVVIMACLGGYYYINYVDIYLEHFKNNKNKDCPNLLIQKGNKLYLKYTSRAEIPGVNPIEFNNLEEYVEFTKYMRHKNIHCPVLLLKREYDAQNNEVYKMPPGISEVQYGIQSGPANFNTNKRGNRIINNIRFPKSKGLLNDRASYYKRDYARINPTNKING